MFGLMRHAARIPYCGTCKTLGARYGHRSRILLNHDAVFLAELLIHFSGEPEWSAPYRSFYCLAKPDEIPPVLDYAAAITVVLAHYKIADHREDSRRWRWNAAARFLSPSFRRASAYLRASGFPLEAMDAILRTQRDRETDPKSLADVAEPTAAATAMVFAHGGGSEDLYRIGHRFGYLIYLLDAFEDRAKDQRNGSFNALARFPEIDGRVEILKTAEEMNLPEPFQSRLRTNVEQRLGMRPRVLCGVSRKNLRERWRDAVAFGRSLRGRERIGAAVFAAAIAVAMLFPHHARGSMSSRECLSVPFNLMALSTFFAMPTPKPQAKGGCLNSFGNCCCSGDCCDVCDGCDCPCDC